VDVSQLFPTVAAPPIAEAVAIAPTALPPLTDNETINFLLIGSDKRPGSSYRTDTLVIAIIWPKEGQVSLVSIPRDLWIILPLGCNVSIPPTKAERFMAQVVGQACKDTIIQRHSH
jgi:hypothetical protein